MKIRYIYELIRDNNRVIIPNFGAFILKEKKGSSLISTGDYLNITFNDFLKFNDGVLVDYIADKEKVNKLEAESQVVEFVNLIKENLEKEGHFDLEGVGELVLDNLGKIKLSREKKSQEPIKIIKSKPIVEVVPPFIKKIVEKETKKTIQKPVAKTEIKKPVKPISKPVISKKEPVVDYLAYQKKSNNGIWILISILFIVIILSVLYLSGYTDSYFNNDAELTELKSPDILSDDESDTTGYNEIATEDSLLESIVLSADSLSRLENPDTIIALPQEKESLSDSIDSSLLIEKKEALSVNYFEGKYYHVIAASYNNKKEAEEFVRLLNNEGYHSRIINKNNNYYRVSFDSFKTKEEVLVELNKIVNNREPKAWYLYYIID